MEENQTLKAIGNVLKSTEEKTKYLDLIEKRIDETNRNKYRSLVYLVILFFAFSFISISKIEGITFEPFEKIDSKLLLYIIPSLFSACYCYYLISWFYLKQLKHIYSNLIAALFNIEEESILHQMANQYDFMDIFEKSIESDNESALGCITNLILLPVFVVIILIPFVFPIYAIILLQQRYYLTFSSTLMVSLIPILSFIIFILIILKIRKSAKT
jgi:hypothetical protein